MALACIKDAVFLFEKISHSTLLTSSVTDSEGTNTGSESDQDGEDCTAPGASLLDSVVQLYSVHDEA